VHSRNKIITLLVTIIIASVGTVYAVGGTNIIFKTSDGVAAHEVMRITSDQEVGIGTANPQSKLDVNGSLNVAGAITSPTIMNLQSQIKATIGQTGPTGPSGPTGSTGNMGSSQIPIVLSMDGCPSCGPANFWFGYKLASDPISTGYTIPINGTLKNLYAQIQTPGTTTNMTVTLAGIDQTLSCTISNVSNKCNDLSKLHSIPVMAGQIISIHLQSNTLSGGASASLVLT
jgi:hypothetical protein